jgi:hypothetical protein
MSDSPLDLSKPKTLKFMVSGCAGFNSRSVVHSVTDTVA